MNNQWYWGVINASMCNWYERKICGHWLLIANNLRIASWLPTDNTHWLWLATKKIIAWQFMAWVFSSIHWTQFWLPKHAQLCVACYILWKKHQLQLHPLEEKDKINLFSTCSYKHVVEIYCLNCLCSLCLFFFLLIHLFICLLTQSCIYLF